MLGSIYTSLAGMLSFSKSLDVTGANVTNLNTPGYKSNDATFKDLLYKDQSGSIGQEAGSYMMGQGVDFAGTSRNFGQGEIQSTGRDTDVAIDGEGFFILENDDQTYLTRAGRFDIDEDGFFVDSSDGAKVLGISPAGQRSPINLSDDLYTEHTPTTELVMSGNLTTGSTSGHTINSVSLIDSVGGLHVVDIEFTIVPNTAPVEWDVEITDDQGVSIGTGSLQFFNSGMVATGSEEMQFTLTPDGAAAASTITIRFGDNVRQIQGGSNSTLEVEDNDGKPRGSLVSLSIDANGRINYSYSNGDTAKGVYIALAQVNAKQDLVPSGQSRFLVPDSVDFEISRAGTIGLGSLNGGSIELANIELSQQFTEIVIAQRGFQASSQVLNISSELLGELFKSSGGR